MKYEYKTIVIETSKIFNKKSGIFNKDEIDASEFTSTLNSLGKKDWELVNSFPSKVASGEISCIISIFKRPIS